MEDQRQAAAHGLDPGLGRQSEEPANQDQSHRLSQGGVDLADPAQARKQMNRCKYQLTRTSRYCKLSYKLRINLISYERRLIALTCSHIQFFLFRLIFV